MKEMDVLDVAMWTGIALALVGLLFVVAAAVDGLPLLRGEVIQHGCGAYVCDERGVCRWQWADEEGQDNG